MPSPLHEQILDLLRGRPDLAAELLCRAAGLPVDRETAATARSVSQTFAQLRPPEYRADLVVEVGAPCTELAIVVEVQLTTHAEKQGSWPQYLAVLWGRLRCPVWLLVVAVDDVVAGWCAQTIEMGGMRLQPVVVGPKEIPLVTDPRAARAAPELAVISALAHARDPEGPAICKVATEAVLSQRLPERYTCIDLMLSRLPELARRALEEWMSTTHEYQSELFRRLVDQGRAEGKAEGKAEGEAKGKAEGEAKGKAEGEAKGKAEAILAVLTARGLAVPEVVAAGVRACRDLDELDRLLRRAVLVRSADELLV
ncbi:MAG: hypothetical protein HY907_14870 [Deltaproteobacteria bacterium]|nr:hypothetical protein [Deltaproteobacteria bacterium]